MFAELSTKWCWQSPITGPKQKKPSKLQKNYCENAIIRKANEYYLRDMTLTSFPTKHKLCFIVRSFVVMSYDPTRPVWWHWSPYSWLLNWHRNSHVIASEIALKDTGKTNLFPSTIQYKNRELCEEFSRYSVLCCLSDCYQLTKWFQDIYIFLLVKMWKIIENMESWSVMIVIHKVEAHHSCILVRCHGLAPLGFVLVTSLSHTDWPCDSDACVNNVGLKISWIYQVCYARSMYQRQGQVITPHIYCGM